MQSAQAVIHGGSIITASPGRRVQKFKRVVPFNFPAYSVPPKIYRSAIGASAGDMAGGAVLLGSAIGNITGMVHYACGASTGNDVAAQDLGVNAAKGAYCHAFGSWVSRATTATYGSSAIRTMTNIRSKFFLSFWSDCITFGVAAGSSNENPVIRVYADNGSGYKSINTIRPYPAISGGPQILYYDFSAESTSSGRRFLVVVDAAFSSIVLRQSDKIIPVDPRKEFLTAATFGDSIGYTLDRVPHMIGAIAHVWHGDGGTGYAKPNLVNNAGAAPTSNADTNFTTSSSSMSGNLGFNDGTISEFGLTNRTDALIAGKPDILIGALGINDSTQNDVDPTYGWRISSSVLKVWQRLRAGLGSSVLACVDPWSGAQRGTNGISGLEMAVATTIRSQFAQIPGPTIWIDGHGSTWLVRREDGTTVAGSTGSGPWVTGIGTVAAPTGIGNADLYIGDGTHPGGWASTTLSAPVTLPVTTLPVVASSGGSSNFPPVGQLSIQPPGTIVAYPGQVVSYTSHGATSFSGCVGGTGTFPAGSNVYLVNTVPGEDYYGNKVAAALCDALAAL